MGLGCVVEGRGGVGWGGGVIVYCWYTIDKGDYPEKVQVFCPNKQRSFEPFMCLDLVHDWQRCVQGLWFCLLLLLLLLVLAEDERLSNNTLLLH